MLQVVDFSKFKSKSVVSSSTNKLYEFFVFSYLPEDVDLRNRRKSALIWQKNEVFAYFPDARINYVLQNFRSEDMDIFNDTRCNIVVDSKKPLGISKARNLALEYFYKSNLDFGVFLDDDAFFISKSDQRSTNNSLMSTTNIIDNMFCEEVDMWVPVNAAATPWTKLFNENIDIYNKYIWGSRTSKLKATCFFMKNIAKHKGKEIYFDEEFKVCEDEEFAINFILNGFKIYVINNILLKEKNRDFSTLFDSMSARNGIMEDFRNKIYKKHNIIDRNGFMITERTDKKRNTERTHAIRQLLHDSGHSIKDIFVAI